jgi:Holliday junction resolvasome RuvABC ATP-dependent DNA helicase subunit
MSFFDFFKRAEPARQSYDDRMHSVYQGIDFCTETIIPDSFIEAWDKLHDYNQPDEDAGTTTSQAVEAGADQIQPTPLTLKVGEPDCFYEGEGSYVYRGQDRTKLRIMNRLNTLAPHERFKCLFVGTAGTGKTTIARLVAIRLNKRRRDLGLEEGQYYELLPAQLEDRLVLDRFMSRLITQPYATVFIDEIHKLTELERWFHVLHDSGQPRWPLLDGRMIDIPATVSFIGATTDPGQMDNTSGGAMRRRMEPEFRLDEPDVATLAQIVEDTARGYGMSVQKEGAVVIAERSYYPWFVKMIFNEVQLLARLAKVKHVNVTMAIAALDLLEIDKMGLRKEDREVIRCLLRVPRRLVTKDVVRYSMSEEALCAAAGIDRGTYKKRVQPKLLRTGLLMTLGGQCLTDRAVTDYGWLREVS